MNKLNSIQAMRGIAALMVVLFHYRVLINYDSLPLGDILFSKGFFGVDLFFIISGFIITYTTKNNNETVLLAVKSFYIKRLVRILPTFTIMLILATIFSGKFSQTPLSETVITFIQNLSLLPQLSDNGPFYINTGGILGVRWTLTYELYFYFIFGACFLFGTFRFTALILIITTMLILIPIINFKSLTLNVVGYDFPSPYISLFTNPIIWDFLLGVLMAVSFERLAKYKGKFTRLALITSFLYSFWAIFLAPINNYGVFEAGLPLSITILLLMVEGNSVEKIIPKPLIKLGDISYSLYLVHIIVSNVTGGLVNKIFGYGHTHGGLYFVTLTSTSIILAYYSHKWIEVRLSRKIMNVLISPEPPTPTTYSVNK